MIKQKKTRKRVVKIKKGRYNIGKKFCSMQLFFKQIYMRNRFVKERGNRFMETIYLVRSGSCAGTGIFFYHVQASEEGTGRNQRDGGNLCFRPERCQRVSEETVQGSYSFLCGGICHSAGDGVYGLSQFFHAICFCDRWILLSLSGFIGMRTATMANWSYSFRCVQELE